MYTFRSIFRIILSLTAVGLILWTNISGYEPTNGTLFVWILVVFIWVVSAENDADRRERGGKL